MDDYENQHKFSQLQFLQHHNLEKQNVLNGYIHKIFFHQSFPDIDKVYQRSRYMAGLFNIWTSACENI